MRAPARPLHVVALSWRDSGHPEAGGAEVYLEEVLGRLAEEGHRVTVLTARYPGSTRTQTRHGITLHRAGGRFTVYLRALLHLASRRLGRVDVVVDVQNGMPFLARLVTRRPVVVLCHHVHREQWSIALGHTPVGRLAARVGWFVESRLAPRVMRGCRYVAVSEVTRRELVDLGVRAEDITVVHNGTPSAPLAVAAGRGENPEIVVLGRLVPHKRIEHAVRAVAHLLPTLPDLRLTVIGHGWWEPQVLAEVERLGLHAHVEVTGWVEESVKHAALGRAWVQATPSVKEGWGLAVVEAGTHGCPSVAYRDAGGVAESILDDVTGLLVDDDETLFAEALGRVLRDPALQRRLGTAATGHAARFSWQGTADGIAEVLAAATGVEPLGRLAAERVLTLDREVLGEPALDGHRVLDLAEVPAPRRGLDDAVGSDRAERTG